MSRVGKNPIPLPADVEVKTEAEEIIVEGPLGALRLSTHPSIAVKVEGGAIVCSRATNAEDAAAMWGTMRANLSNMVVGVTKGFEKKLTLVGVGYRAQAQGNVVNLTLGFSHPVVHKMPEGVKVETPSQTEIVVKGVDKQKVGQVAAELRAYRSPEPYKGKGVRYVDEVVNLKETKKK